MPKAKFESDAIKTGPDKVFIVVPHVQSKTYVRSLEAIQDEIVGLAEAIALDVLLLEVFNVGRIQAGYFFGSGQRETMRMLVDQHKPDLVIVNASLSPVQQRNLEKALDCKVIDRTGLILEIFGARAQTKEGRLQVELAALDYQKSRLVRSWTHLERQRGGAGFMGGPGERQIEIDRRLINDRITKIKKELDVVKRTRVLGRKSRERKPYPIVAFVGYTNAGKSTLFNALTGADIFAKDLLFATLDPTMRRLDLPNGSEVILSDTVGFISDLPTQLVAAFRATLEEALHADVLVHVIDCSAAERTAQKDDVVHILEELGISYDDDPRVLELYNKADLLDEGELSDLNRKSKFDPRVTIVSAIERSGFDGFLNKISDIIHEQRIKKFFSIPYKDGKALSWLYDNAEVIEKIDEEEGVRVFVSIEPSELSKFLTHYGYQAE